MALNSDGGFWLVVKGQPGWVRDEGLKVAADEVNRILSVVLGSVNRQVSFANPIESLGQVGTTDEFTLDDLYGSKGMP